MSSDRKELLQQNKTLLGMDSNIECIRKVSLKQIKRTLLGMGG
jgi:hypothetical protein